MSQKFIKVLRSSQKDLYENFTGTVGQCMFEPAGYNSISYKSTEAISFHGSVMHVNITSMLSFNHKLDMIRLAKRLSPDSTPLGLRMTASIARG